MFGSPGLRRDRTPSPLRPRVAGGWGREPRQPPVRRSRSRDPHRQPDRRGEACESRLPGVPGERFQRHAGSRSLRLGSGPRVDGRVPRETARRASAGPPRWQVPVPARSPLRGRARRDRLRRAHRHDGGAPSRVRDVLELRRGRAPLRARTRRHARGAAQARPAVRPHRAGTPLCPTAVRARRPLRPRPDAGRDLQATERLRPRRARRAFTRARRRDRDRRRGRAELDGRPRDRRGDRPEAEETGEERCLGP